MVFQPGGSPTSDIPSHSVYFNIWFETGDPFVSIPLDKLNSLVVYIQVWQMCGLCVLSYL